MQPCLPYQLDALSLRMVAANATFWIVEGLTMRIEAVPS